MQKINRPNLLMLLLLIQIMLTLFQFFLFFKIISLETIQSKIIFITTITCNLGIGISIGMMLMGYSICKEVRNDSLWRKASCNS